LQVNEQTAIESVMCEDVPIDLRADEVCEIIGISETTTDITALLNLAPHHLEKLTREHGLSIETIKESGLFSAKATTLNRILNRTDIACDGIVIPYVEGFSRVRLDVPLILKNGKTAKYLSPIGSENSLYVPKSIESVLKDSSTPIYITEGEFKALKLTQEGFPCIGLPGIWGFSRDKKLLPDFDEINLKGRKVTIILDSDARRKIYGEK
jgi:putative DNA primase/helicase